MIDLFGVKNGLLNNKVTVKEASDVLKQENIQLFIHQILDRFDKGQVALDGTDASVVASIVDIAYYIYTYSGLETGITDSEYDKLYELLSINGKEDFVTLPLLIGDEKEVSHHSYPQLRGTLSKIHYLKQPVEKENKSRKSLDSWIEKTEALYYRKTGKHIDLRNEDVYVFPKWDGVSVIFEFNEDGDLIKALTRGYTKFNTAEDISHHFKGLVRHLRRLDGGSLEKVKY